MSTDRPDYGKAIDAADTLARDAITFAKRMSPDDYSDMEIANAAAAASIATSLVTLTRQLADLRPADIADAADTIAAAQ
jgi:hypothetical protein